MQIQTHAADTEHSRQAWRAAAIQAGFGPLEAAELAFLCWLAEGSGEAARQSRRDRAPIAAIRRLDRASEGLLVLA
jgi:hypothetical protein